jgi:hypothetical protein
MPEIVEPTFFNTDAYQGHDPSASTRIDPFENAPVDIIAWRDSVKRRQQLKRDAKKNRELSDLEIRSLPVIETSSSLPTDETLPVIEAIESVSMEGSVQSVGRDRDLPVIEDNQTDTQQPIPEKTKGKNSGCIGTYRKGKLEYYRYSCRIEGKVKHFHIGSSSSPSTKQMVKRIMSWIDVDTPSRWIVSNFFTGASYPDKQTDCDDAYERILIREKGAEEARKILENLRQTPKLC